MLSQLERLSCEVDGRYASDTELQFLTDYVQTFDLRVKTYNKLQEVETALVQQTYAKIRSLDPDLFKSGTEDISGKWKRDTLRVLRYTAIAVLMDDSETLRERFLLWFQTIMRAFNAERGCNTTYAVLQEVVKQNLPPAQANLVCPVLELNRRSLGVAS
jgi:Phycobilisome protein